MGFTYSVIIEPSIDGGFEVCIPALNNSVTEGETLEEARTMAKDLIEVYLESLIADGEPIPQEAPPFKGETITAHINVQVA